MNATIDPRPNGDDGKPWVSPHEIRTQFSQAMSAMYRREVPAYGQLLSIVENVNAKALADNPEWREWLASETRLSEERHGAIRLGTAAELAMMRRLFAVMGMFPVGYYDLSVAGIPVHSTAFRPIHREALARNPFRVFTSLLRLELISDPALRAQAEAILQDREIFTAEVVELIEQFERDGGLLATDAERFVSAALETFRWHDEALVDADTYQQLHDAHRLIADVVSFKGPHINHLTPRTLDIDACQQSMIEAGLPAKAVIEGPPRRECPILLRQTAFTALTETIHFISDGQAVSGKHTARFGEIEQRGIALTPKGRALYDDLLAQAQQSDSDNYQQALEQAFAAFPDDWETLRTEQLAYFDYALTAAEQPLDSLADIEQGLMEGSVSCRPLIYEDFLPVSAAGIFQSNLGGAKARYDADANQSDFEAALGKPVIDQFAWYDRQEQASKQRCLNKS